MDVYRMVICKADGKVDYMIQGEEPMGIQPVLTLPHSRTIVGEVGRLRCILRYIMPRASFAGIFKIKYKKEKTK